MKALLSPSVFAGGHPDDQNGAYEYSLDISSSKAAFSGVRALCSPILKMLNHAGELDWQGIDKYGNLKVWVALEVTG